MASIRSAVIKSVTPCGGKGVLLIGSIDCPVDEMRVVGSYDWGAADWAVRTSSLNALLKNLTIVRCHEG